MTFCPCPHFLLLETLSDSVEVATRVMRGGKEAVFFFLVPWRGRGTNLYTIAAAPSYRNGWTFVAQRAAPERVLTVYLKQKEMLARNTRGRVVSV